MKKAVKRWFGILAGLATCSALTVALSACTTAESYAVNTHEIKEEFSDISIKTDTADVTFVPSLDGQCKVVCYEQQKLKHSVSVLEGTLIVEVADERAWYEYIGILTETPKITVHLPETEYATLRIEESTGDIELYNFTFESIGVAVSTGDVKCYASATEGINIATSTGDVFVENSSAGSLSVSVSTGMITVENVTCAGDVAVGVSTGKTYLTNMTCKNVTSNGSTGDISLRNVVAVEKFSIERSTGDVTFDKCDAAEIIVDTDTGDVTGTLLSEKVFAVQTDTGSCSVPSSNVGGRCAITTDTGDIEISIVK